MTKQSTIQRKRSPFVAIALLSVFLGAQAAVFATVDPTGGGGLPPGYSYGYSIGWYYQSIGASNVTIGAAITEGCGGKYGFGTSSFTTCKNAGVKGARDEAGA